jgi:hypothetical protein
LEIKLAIKRAGQPFQMMIPSRKVSIRLFKPFRSSTRKDEKTMRKRNLVLAAGVMVMVLAIPGAVFADPGTFFAHLHPSHHFPHASGSAEFQNDPHHDILSLSVSIENVFHTPTVAVLINGELLDFIDLDDTGSGQLFLSTAHGDDVPDLGSGDRVRIVDAMDGHAVIVKGRFNEVNP